MQRIQWSTDGVPEREQFAVWRDEWQVPFGIRPEREGPAAAPFKGTVVTRRVGPAVHTRARSDAHTAVRGRAEIARRGWDAYVLYREAGGGAWFDRGGREFVAEAGDLTISDPNLPYATRAQEGFAFDFWVLPRAEIDRHLPAGRPPLSLHLAGRDPLGDVLGSYMDALARQLDALPGPAAEPMLDNLCRLVAITAGAAAPRAVEGGREAVRAARLERARRHVERHLAEPGLTVAGVAAAVGVSVRQLHLLFEPTGESFARYLQRRRLEEARAALADPAGAGRTVAEIAFAWGFADLTTFYRAFRRAYGAAPGELRPARRLRPPPGSP
jgi:AraC-like DNA-binding protein